MSEAPELISVTPVLEDWTGPLEWGVKAGEYAYDYTLSLQWQPIETAPKDGTWILGWRKRKALEDQIETWQYTADTSSHWFWANSADTNDYDEEPTHWMPLPKPPT